MYGTAKVENRTKNFRKGNKQRNRAIKRLSTTTPYISSGSNALPIAGGLAQYYQIQYVVAAQKLGRAEFRGCEKSQGGLDSNARQQSVTPSPSEWEGQPPNRATPLLCTPTCHDAGRTWGRRRVGGRNPPCSLRYVPPGYGETRLLAKASPPDWIHRPNCRFGRCGCKSAEESWVGRCGQYGDLCPGNLIILVKIYGEAGFVARIFCALSTT